MVKTWIDKTKSYSYRCVPKKYKKSAYSKECLLCGRLSGFNFIWATDRHINRKKLLDYGLVESQISCGVICCECKKEKEVYERDKKVM